MTSKDFCNWLQGFLDLTEQKEIQEEQVTCIKRHLALVFYHEIDPSYGDDNHQTQLMHIHHSDYNELIKC